MTMPWHVPAKIKRGGQFGVFTGMWDFQSITLYRETSSVESEAKQAKIRFSSSNANTKVKVAEEKKLFSSFQNKYYRVSWAQWASSRVRLGVIWPEILPPDKN